MKERKRPVPGYRQGGHLFHLKNMVARLFSTSYNYLPVRSFHRCLTSILAVAGLFILLAAGKVLAQDKAPTDLIRKFRSLRDTTTWNQVKQVPLKFPVHHPQGMVKVGPYFYMSSVEVLNREAGQGVGHLFKFDANGKLLADVKLGEGSRYHPGGIDYDGQHIWVPVAEYRPSSSSIVYKVNPETRQVTEVFRFADHLGGIVHNTDAHTLHGISWGSRNYYDWKLDARGGVLASGKSPGQLRVPNPSYYIDYQDCQYVGNNLMLCGGLKNYRQGTSTFRLGGLELVDLTKQQPVHQVPVPLWAPSGRPMTQNPFWLESTPGGIRAYFVPDDNEATLFVYEATVR
ncbi:DUF6454 family protein [Telluribacter sp.]|jgi:hypothetical protein|uniref:DUF6454 family protein n=1 Tax=Telluribacter sp. TaxID=1978767 RepID=UPI002E143B19|nr:DUF6454 family protein [Telluribacter sp.]